jgi:hypothetical protein
LFPLRIGALFLKAFGGGSEVQSFLQLGNLPAQLPLAQIGKLVRIGFSLIDRRIMARPEMPITSLAAEASLMLASSRTF